MATEYPYKITMLPVLHGDSIFLEFGKGKNAFRMMIDGGPAGGKEELFKQLESFARENQKIDVLVVTHYDSDHIEGVLKLLEEPRYSALVKEVWHNGLKEIAPDLRKKASETEEKVYRQYMSDNATAHQAESGEISGKQSLDLARLLDREKKTINSISDGGAITAQTPSRSLGPKQDVEVFFLLPERETLNKQLNDYRKALKKIVLSADVTLSEYCRSAFERYIPKTERSVGKVKPISAQKVINAKTPVVDQIPALATSECADADDKLANASSIAIVIRYHGKKFLFPGDATPKLLAAALERWKKVTGENLHFDVVKLPHHGSKYSCVSLLEESELDGDVFLVSTNGKMYDHPDLESLAKIVCRSAGPQPYRRLLFNYDVKEYVFFHDTDAQKAYNYTAEHCCTVTET